MRQMPKSSRRKFIRTSAALGATTMVGAPFIARGAGITLRIASLAPQGSSWAKAFERIAREISEKTDGDVKVKLYLGGVMGDETAMVRKMRHGQLDGAAVTSVGLGEINPQLRMLQLPLMFKDYAQLDYVRTQMSSTFEGLLESGGFKLGAWGDVGMTYLFSNQPVRTLADLKATKMWVWDTDPVARKFMSVAGVNAVALGVPDVLASLETGLIDAFVNSPYGAIALQWYAKARFVTNLKVGVATGGSVLTKKAWASLPPDIQKMVMEVTNKANATLLARIRSDNQKAMRTLKEKGIQVVEPADFATWAAMAVRVREGLVADKVLDGALVATMLDHLKQAPH